MIQKPPKDYPVEYVFVNEEGVLCCYAKAGWGHQKKFNRKKVKNLEVSNFKVVKGGIEE